MPQVRVGVPDANLGLRTPPRLPPLPVCHHEPALRVRGLLFADAPSHLRQTICGAHRTLLNLSVCSGNRPALPLLCRTHFLKSQSSTVRAHPWDATAASCATSPPRNSPPSPPSKPSSDPASQPRKSTTALWATHSRLRPMPFTARVTWP